jgi:hypothetical protein
MRGAGVLPPTWALTVSGVHQLMHLSPASKPAPLPLMLNRTSGSPATGTPAWSGRAAARLFSPSPPAAAARWSRSRGRPSPAGRATECPRAGTAAGWPAPAPSQPAGGRGRRPVSARITRSPAKSTLRCSRSTPAPRQDAADRDRRRIRHGKANSTPASSENRLQKNMHLQWVVETLAPSVLIT